MISLSSYYQNRYNQKKFCVGGKLYDGQRVFGHEDTLGRWICTFSWTNESFAKRNETLISKCNELSFGVFFVRKSMHWPVPCTSHRQSKIAKLSNTKSTIELRNPSPFYTIALTISQFSIDPYHSNPEASIGSHVPTAPKPLHRLALHLQHHIHSSIETTHHTLPTIHL